MSVLGKKWVVANDNSGKSAIEKITENKKDITEMDLENFHDPFLFRDMAKSVERIKQAIASQERIIVFGDYDVDGITGTAILFQTLKKLGAAVSCRIPHRVEDGYGVSNKFIEEFVEKDIKILITVDCGISCREQVLLGNESGIDTIITDHHNIPKDKPVEAYSILHPKEEDSNYPDRELTGAGVAFKFAHALIKEFMPEEEENHLFSLIDLASLGTVADLGPLKGENRFIVKKGLKALAETQWIGLRQIMERAGINKNDRVDAGTIGFKIGPRINASGRIGSPYTALTLLLQEEKNEKVTSLGFELEELNNKRREITDKTLQSAEAKLSDKETTSILICEHPDWHVGIVGLVAGRLAEKYQKPAIIMQDFGDIFVASARSPEFFNVIEAITECKEYLEGFGGHSAAAGFSVKKENLAAFKEKISKYASEKLDGLDNQATLKIDCSVSHEDINFDLLNSIEALGPFGMANEQPILVLNQVEPIMIKQIGKEKNHLSFAVRLDTGDMRVIAFNMGEFASEIREHQKIDLAFKLSRNVWRDKESLQLQALDINLNKE